jgi:hypothetical protein
VKVVYEADADVERAFDWYERQRIGLGSQLLDELAAAEGLVLENPLAAYLHSPHAMGAKVARSAARERGLVVDFAADGQPLGVEITAPTLVDLETLNGLLHELHVHEIEVGDLAPLRPA